MMASQSGKDPRRTISGNAPYTIATYRACSRALKCSLSVGDSALRDPTNSQLNRSFTVVTVPFRPVQCLAQSPLSGLVNTNSTAPSVTEPSKANPRVFLSTHSSPLSVPSLRSVNFTTTSVTRRPRSLTLPSVNSPSPFQTDPLVNWSAGLSAHWAAQATSRPRTVATVTRNMLSISRLPGLPSESRPRRLERRTAQYGL